MFWLHVSARHIVTGGLKIMPDSRIRSIICKGPKSRIPSPIDFTKCREVIAGTYNNFVIAGACKSFGFLETKYVKYN